MSGGVGETGNPSEKSESWKKSFSGELFKNVKGIKSEFKILICSFAVANLFARENFSFIIALRLDDDDAPFA